jgi:3-oxoacyl-[acyl-carrier protein] reductase
VALAPKNIRVNAVAPGSIDFPGGYWDRMHQNDPSMYDAVVAAHPFKRHGRPEEVADAVVYLASTRASWISGVTLVVDGAQHKGIV